MFTRTSFQRLELSKFLLKIDDVSQLPSVLIVLTLPTDSVDTLEISKKEFATVGLSIDTYRTIRRKTDVTWIAERGRRRRVDTCGHRIFLLDGVENTASNVVSALVNLVDMTSNTSRYVILTKSEDSIDPRLRSRGLTALVHTQNKGNDMTPYRVVGTLYSKMRKAACSKCRLDVTARHVVNHIIKLIHSKQLSVSFVLRMFVRHAIKHGDLWVSGIAVHYAHSATLSPRLELVSLQSFVNETMAQLEINDVHDT